MNKKHLLLVSLFTPLAFAPVNSGTAAPLVSIGDNVDVFFNGSSSVRWISNVYRDNEDEVDDLLLTLSPGFEVNVGRGVSNADLSIITRYDLLRYSDQSQLNTELFHIRAVGSYRTSRLDLDGSVSFDQEQSTSGNEQVDSHDSLIELDNTQARLYGEYRLSPKFSFGAGARYTEREYTTFEDELADRETISFPVDLFYELTPKVDLSAGYTYSETEVGDTSRRSWAGLAWVQRDTSGYEYSSHFFNLGARGNLLPKLTGYFKVGYRVRSTDDSVVRTTSNLLPSGTSFTDRDDSGMLGLDADLTWAATPKVTTRLGLSRDFGVGGEGQTTENTSVDLSASYSLNSYWAATANLGYTLRDYESDREDDQYLAGLRLSYTPNQYWRFSTGYTYSENSSTERERSYENHILSLSASLRY